MFYLLIFIMLSNKNFISVRSFYVDEVESRPRWLTTQRDATTDVVCHVLTDENHDFDNLDWQDFSARSQISLGVNLKLIPQRKLVDGNADVIDSVTNTINSLNQ